MSTEPIRLIMDQYGVDFETAKHIYETGRFPEPETSSQATLRTFWEWAATKYSSGEIEVIRDNPNAILQFYIRNIQGTQWDVGVEPLPRGRPEAEKYGITENDWQTLEMLGGNPAKIERELRTWMSTGHINQFQARDIWNELEFRVTQRQIERLETAPETTARLRKEEIARLRETREVGIAGIPKWQLETWEDRVKAGEITSEQVSRYIERREGAQEERRVKQARARAWQYTPPQPEYAPAFEEARAGIGGAQPWRDWFASQYPSLVGRFRAALPKMEQRFYPGLTPREAEAQIEETWAETLRRRRPELREEYATRHPYGQYGRPWAFAPRIQTVGF